MVKRKTPLGLIRGAYHLLFKKPQAQKQINNYFQMLDGYTPAWETYDGGVYEMELTRACIHAFATHASKLQPAIEGADLRHLKAVLANRPNPFMTTAQFLYKVATITEVCNTCYIIPLLDKFDRIIGFYPALPTTTEVIDVNGEPFLRYTFGSGQQAAIELGLVGIIHKFSYRSDIRGESNDALQPTLQLIATQEQGIEEGIKNSASFRFMANVTNFAKTDDLKKERKRFTDENFSAADGSGGLLLFPNTYTNVQQIKSDPKIVDPEQMTLIQTRVFDYFGCNLEVLQNKVNGDAWAAYYEGKIEPFAIQLSQAMTCMTYTVQERARGNAIVWSANRLQYMTNVDKLAVSSQMFDRGIFSRNDIMDIWNLPHVDGGDKYYIRKEYIEVSKLEANGQPAAPAGPVPAEPAPETTPAPAEENPPPDGSEGNKEET